MTEIEAYEYVIQLYPKCGLKTVAVFGMDITPFLKYGFRDVQYEPKEGEFDCVVAIDNYPNLRALKNNGILITNGDVAFHALIPIHEGKLDAYKLKL